MKPDAEPAPLARAIALLGGRSRFAARLGVSVVMVHKWATGKNQVTAERARQIEDATGGAVGRHELRPDLFGPPTAPIAEEATP